MLDQKTIDDVLVLLRSKLESANKMNWHIQIDQDQFYDEVSDNERITRLGDAQVIGEKWIFRFGVTDHRQ